MEWVPWVIAAVVVIGAGRMTLNTFRQTKADAQELVRNPTGRNLAGGAWNLLCIILLIVTFSRDGFAVTVAILGVWLFGLYVLVQLFDRNWPNRAVALLDLAEKIAAALLALIALGVMYWAHTTGASKLWFIAGVAIFVVGGGIVHAVLDYWKDRLDL
jgi:hypothetical protein